MWTINPINGELLFNGNPVPYSGFSVVPTFTVSPVGPVIQENSSGNLSVSGATAGQEYSAVAVFDTGCETESRPFSFTGAEITGQSTCVALTGVIATPNSVEGDAGADATISLTVIGGNESADSTPVFTLPIGWSVSGGSYPNYEVTGSIPDASGPLTFSVTNDCSGSVSGAVNFLVTQCESTVITSTIPVPKITTFPGQVSPPAVINYDGADPVIRITVDPLSALVITQNPQAGTFEFEFQAPGNADETDYNYTIEAEDPCTGDVTTITGTYCATACPDPVVEVETDCEPTAVIEPVDPPHLCFLDTTPTLIDNAGEVSLTWGWNVNATGAVQWGATTALGNSLTPETSTNFSTHVQRFAFGDSAAPGALFYFSIQGVDADGNVCNATNPARADGLWELARP